MGKEERNRRFGIRQGLMLPPSTESVMASFKEPLQPVKDGHGYYGTISYDKEQKFTQCHICGYFVKSLGTHVYPKHQKTVREYKLLFGLPTNLSLTAPKAENKNYERWAKLTPEEKQASIKRLLKGQEGKKGIPARKKSLYHKNIEGRCPDQLLEKVEKLAKKLGRTPTRREFEREYKGYVGSINLTFGSWGEALQILKLTPQKAGKKTVYDREILIKYLYDFKQRYNREPTTDDLVRGLLPSYPTYVKHFGSFVKAKEYIKEFI